MSGDALTAARAAVARGAWQEALDALDRDLDGGGGAARSAENLELRAVAAYGNGEFEAAVSAWEDLHAQALAAGDVDGAARAAAMIAMYLMMDTGLMSPVRGWVRRAERLLEGRPDAPANALVAMVRTYERFMCGDMDGAREQAAASIELGSRLGVAPAVVIGRVATARVMIYDGRVEEGLDRLDEVGALLMAGGADPLTTGMMYCELICAAQGLALHDRAAEWTEVMEHWRHDAAFGGINGRCRVHRAEILRVTGPCDAAEAEALGACEELRPWMRREFGWPLAELGTIRLRKGDLAGAEAAFVAAHEHAWSPHPGFALLRLAQGDVGAASALIADAIAHPFDIPSKERPPFGDLRLAPLLDAQVEIAAEADDLGTARDAAARLRAIADSYPSHSLQASALLADARVSLLAGELEEAIERATGAMTTWAELGAPFETAAARVVLGEAHRRAGRDDLTRLEWTAARAAFEQFGAAGRADRVGRLLDGEPTATPPHIEPEEPAAVFRCDGDARSVGFGGRTVLLRELQGFRYLERMLAEPGREFHVLDLVAVEHGTLPGHARHDHADGELSPAGSGLPTLDDDARAAYRRRLADVDEDIEDAERANDLGRLELARRDREYLVAELTRAVGLGGRDRTTGSSAERARTSVARSLRYARARIREHLPDLAAHLEHAVHTGTYCRYEPDPTAPIHWEL